MEFQDKNSEDKQNPSVYIIILNWNGYKDTYECLNSVFKINYNNYKVILVDNDSCKNEADELYKSFPQIEMVKSQRNLGFSGGNNLGIKYAQKYNPDYFLLLNNDTIVEPDFLSHLQENISSNEVIGICVPKIIYYTNPQIVWYAGGYFSKLRGSGFTIGEGKNRNLYTKNKFVTFATGCCLLIKAKIFDEVGLMDENYFLYNEDMDYCIRCSNAGYKILFVANSVIYHKVSKSTKRSNNLLPLYYVTRNRLYLTKKILTKYFFLSFFIIFFTFFIKSLYWILTGEIKKVKIIKKAFIDFFHSKMGKI